VCCYLMEMENRMETSLVGRRSLFKKMGVVATGVAVGAMASGVGNESKALADDALDLAVLNFALNLEYLEAEYYLRAVYGRGLADVDRGIAPGAVTGGKRVRFSRRSLIGDYAREIERDDLGAAASILAVEAYHAGTVRNTLYALSKRDRSIRRKVQAISDARDGADGTVLDKDQSIISANRRANLVPTDENSLAYSRSTDEVLQIVYLNANKTVGGFFPAGLNGAVR